MKTLKRPSLVDSTTESVKEHIISHNLSAGDRLPSEKEFCEGLGVSRRVVREALKALESVGIVNIKAGDGAYVSDLSYDRLIDHCAFAIERSGQTIEELASARRAIELGAIETAISRVDACTVRKLEELVQSVLNAGSVKEHIKADCEFHKTLIGISGNGPLIEFCRLIDAFFYRMAIQITELPDGHSAKTAEEHKAIVEAIKQQDIDALRQIIQVHYTPYIGNTSEYAEEKMVSSS
jgi:GntR family transcriptional repressor for pyruvate dehydrogenase complex